MQLRHPPHLARVDVLTPSFGKGCVLGAMIVALYGVSVQYGWQTSGELYQQALKEQKQCLQKREQRILSEKERELEELEAKKNRDRQKLRELKAKKQKRIDLSAEEECQNLPWYIMFLPDGWGCMYIFGTVSLHLFFHFICHWSVEFRATCLFSSFAGEIRAGCFMKVVPALNKGPSQIVAVADSDVRMKFVFQSQTYEVIDSNVEDDDLIGGVAGKRVAGVRLVQHRANNLPIEHYLEMKGFQTEKEVEQALDLFGRNELDTVEKTWGEIYRERLMSPLSVFQMFCSLLWMFDEYWKYTLFTLLSIFIVEIGTTNRQQQAKETLKKMSNASYKVQVYRQKKWQELATEELLPGDIISLHHSPPVPKAEDLLSLTEEDKRELAQSEKELQKLERRQVKVPCDCVLLKGSAVVNEANLTGESAPQMKDGLEQANNSTTRYDMLGVNRVNTLFSGTQLVMTYQDTEAAKSCTKYNRPYNPPDGGIVCGVLGTGFSSTQGELFRTIEFSTVGMITDPKETAMQILMLLSFAFAAAFWVIHNTREEKPTFKTLIKCALIMTSIVPPTLPLQMAYAVNTALVMLHEKGIYCTEPWRICNAGKVMSCFFDKTGTLTSDQMTVGRLVEPAKDDAESYCSKMFDEASPQAAMVIAGCQSLVQVDEQAMGDPIEVAALRGVRWSISQENGTARPGTWSLLEKQMKQVKEYIRAQEREGNLRDEEDKQKLKTLDEALKIEREKGNQVSVAVKHRFHFNSHLARMSVISDVQSASQESWTSGLYCLTKGSPEAVAQLLESKPEWYDPVFERLAEHGERVLALAYGRLDSNCNYGEMLREDIEKNLTFAGFATFKCATRTDSALVIRALKDSSHKCFMVTGDAPLTALNVAHQVTLTRTRDIANSLILKEHDGDLLWVAAFKESNKEDLEPQGKSAGSTALPKRRTMGGPPRSEPFDPQRIAKLAEKYALVVTGSVLEKAFRRDDAEALMTQLHHVSVFARTSPKLKEDIMRIIATKTQKGKWQECLMCGDGGNDVGALKAADVGLALCSGFGDQNATESERAATEADSGQSQSEAEQILKSIMEKEREANQKRLDEIVDKAYEEMKEKRDKMVEQSDAMVDKWTKEEVRRREARGEKIGVMQSGSIFSAALSKYNAELKALEDKMKEKRNHAAYAASTGQLAGKSAKDTINLAEPGDASAASPFTSRTPSVGCCVDIIRQGRCTLMSVVQQMQAMMIKAMISTYVFAMMSADGTHPSDYQLIAIRGLLTVAALAFAFVSPAKKIHTVRPLPSTFHPAIITSLVGQLAIHLLIAHNMARMAKEYMGPEELQEVIDFEKNRHTLLTGTSILDRFSVPFKPNLLNTVSWLVEGAQQSAVIFVNYRGQPWMRGICENHYLFVSLFGVFALVALCSFELAPFVNDTFNLVPLPKHMRGVMMTAILMSLFGTFCWDRLCMSIFAPEVFQAMVDQMNQIQKEDLIPPMKAAICVGCGVAMTVSSNPLFFMAAAYVFNTLGKENEEEQEDREGLGGLMNNMGNNMGRLF